jgi:hypothetical protein
MKRQSLMDIWGPVGKDLWFAHKAVTDWNYKAGKGGLKYEDFGNFNYGATGAASGYSLKTLQIMAGVVQKVGGAYDPAYGNPWSGFPYGDDPDDQNWIWHGWRYYWKLRENGK